LDKAEIENARITTPERLFRQEWLAEFLEDAGGVFRGVREAIRGKLEDGGFGEFSIGVDLGKYEDFTVIVVMNKETKNVVYFERFKDLDWDFQMKRIMLAVDKFKHSTVLIDSNGVGDSVFDLLNRSMQNHKGATLQSYPIKSNEIKKNMIDNLAIAIETKEIGYPAVLELVGELSIYSYEITESRNIKYNAPSGYHDDCVIALALAYAGVKNSVGGSILPVVSF
jgi:hypothetical protein